MSAQTTSALISATAGSLTVTIRSARLARDQVRYTRAYERRDELLAELYGLLWNVQNEFKFLIRRAGREEELDRESVRQALNAFAQHFNASVIWMPDDIQEDVTALYDEITAYANQVIRAVKEQPKTAHSRGVIARAEEWRTKELQPRMASVRESIRQLLRIENIEVLSGQ